MKLKDLFKKATKEISPEDPRFKEALRDAKDSSVLTEQIIKVTLDFARERGDEPHWAEKILMAHARATSALLATLQKYGNVNLLEFYKEEILTPCYEEEERSLKEKEAKACQKGN